MFATAYLNLFMEAGLSVGEKVVLHAGASGVGTAAIQLCRELGNPCFVTLGSEEKLAACLELGARSGICPSSGQFQRLAAGLVAGRCGRDSGSGWGRILQDNLSCLNIEGRLVLIGLMGGASAQINLGLLLMKRIRVIGSTLRARSVAAKSAVMDQLEAVVWPLIAEGRIKPIIDTTFSITQAEAAQQHVAGNQTIGKVVLEIPQ